MREVFGYDLVMLPPPERQQDPAMPLDKVPSEEARTTKEYALVNVLEHARHPEQMDLGQATNEKMGLLMVVLGMIYCNTMEMTVNKLYGHLKKHGIDSRNKKKHPVFGDAVNLIETEMVRQKYLHKFTRKHNEGEEVVLRWGARAKAEFTERSVLEFMAEVYGEDVEEWVKKLGKVGKDVGAASAADA